MSASTGIARAQDTPRAAVIGPTAATAGLVMAAVVVIWGLGPPVTKLITAPPLVSVAVRFWVSIPLVWAIAYGSGRRMSFAILRQTMVAGALFGINLAFVFAALQHTSVAVLSVIQALQPGLVLLVAGAWLGERATRWHVGWTGVGVLGAGVVVLGGSPEVTGDALGFVFGLVAMVTFTGYYLLNSRVRSTTATDPIQWMCGITLFAGITITPIALLASSPADFRQLAGADWLYLGFVACVVGIAGHTMMSWAHRFIPASRSSLYLLAMNVVAVSAAWPLHDEPITVMQVLGGLVVLGAVAAVVSRPAVALDTRAVPDQPATSSG